MNEIRVMTKKEMQDAFIEALSNYGFRPQPKGHPTYSINQVAKRLRMAHATVKKLVANGTIRSTLNGRITEDAINEYLKL